MKNTPRHLAPEMDRPDDYERRLLSITFNERDFDPDFLFSDEVQAMIATSAQPSPTPQAPTPAPTSMSRALRQAPKQTGGEISRGFEYATTDSTGNTLYAKTLEAIVKAELDPNAPRTLRTTTRRRYTPYGVKVEES